MEEQLSRLKEEALMREQKQEEEYNKQVQHLTQEVLRAKREFEEHLQVSHAHPHAKLTSGLAW